MIERYLTFMYCLQETAKVAFMLLFVYGLFVYIKNWICRKRDDPEDDEDDNELGI